jgi:hypothetical protein
MAAKWLERVKSVPAKTLLDEFGKNNPPAPWNLIQGLKMCGIKFTQLVDTFQPDGSPQHGPRYVGKFTIEECVGSDMLVAALEQGGYGNCPMQTVPLKDYVYVVHDGAEVAMKAVLDYGLQITSVTVDNKDKHIALECTLPINTVVQQEMAQAILSDFAKGKKK